MKVASPAALAKLLQVRLEESGDPKRVLTLSECLVSILPYPVVRAALDLAGKAEYDLALLGFLRRADLVQVDPAVVAAVEREAEAPEPNLDFASDLGDSLLRLRHIVAEGGPAEAPIDPTELRTPTTNGLEARPVEAPPVEAPPVRETVVEAPVFELAIEKPSAPESTSKTPVEPTRDVDPVQRAATIEHLAPILPLEPIREPPSDGPTVARNDIVPPERSDPPLDPRVVTEPEPWVPEPGKSPACWQCSEPLPDRPLVFFCIRCGISQDNRRCMECGDRVESSWKFCARCGTGLSRS